MSAPIHLPVLRAGEAYESLNKTTVVHIQTREPLVDVSQANRGLVAWDLNRMSEHRARLADVPVADLIVMSKKAAESFVHDTLPVGDGEQTLDDYVQSLSGTTGMPQALVRRNVDKIYKAMSEVDQILDGLTRGLDLTVLDEGWTVQGGRPLSYICQTDALGQILPSNSPGVHSLWVPSVPLKVPLVLKPGREEPWTPYRIAQAFFKAGCPRGAFSFYPTDHGGTAEVLLRCDRSMLFGGGATVAPWLDDPRVQIHGPGQSKVLIGADTIDHWEDHIDVIADSIAINGGRSCINASSVWVPSRGDEVAAALAQRLADLVPRKLDDPDAGLAAFGNPSFAEAISQTVDTHLRQEGARDVSADYRGERLQVLDGLTFLAPTIVRAEPGHPLADTEFLFPFASVVEVPPSDLLDAIGPSLAVSAITEDEVLIDGLLRSPKVERLNIGSLGTHVVSWDQPHEGNLFEHLYAQRALQRAS